jgi:nitroreductase
VDLREAIESCGTCRHYRPDRVADDVLARVIDAARHAPSGGNRQPVRFIAVRDPALRRAIADLYGPLWDAYAGPAKRALASGAALPPMLANADHFARHLADVPVHLVVCARIADLYATDSGLGRVSIVAGASVYPAVQNLLLAARAEELGTALTTLLCAAEVEMRRLLAIPEEFATAAMVALGWPARPFPSRLRRRPLREIAFADRFGNALPD